MDSCVSIIGVHSMANGTKFHSGAEWFFNQLTLLHHRHLLPLIEELCIIADLQMDNVFTNDLL